MCAEKSNSKCTSVKIPGFYFDSESKRYFRIPPKSEQTNHNELFHKINSHTPSINNHSFIPKNHKNVRSVMTILEQQRIGLTSSRYKGALDKNMLFWKLFPKKSLKIESDNDGVNIPNSVLLDKKCISLAPNGKYFYLVDNTGISFPRSLYKVSVSNMSNIRFKRMPQHIAHNFCTIIKEFDWVATDQYVKFFYIESQPFPGIQNQPIDLNVRCLGISNNEIVSNEIFTSLNLPPFCTSLIANQSHFPLSTKLGIGSDLYQCVCIYELKFSCVRRVSSMVTSQAFYEENPFLCSGLRNGKVLLWDLRHFWKKPAFTLDSSVPKQTSSIYSIKPLMNDMYLLTKNSAGEIILWDNRMLKKCIIYCQPIEIEYIKHKFSNSRIQLSKDDKCILSKNSDGKFTIWDTYTGKVVRTQDDFMHLCQLVNNDIPELYYSANWGGIEGGLEGIVGTYNDQHEFYTI